MGQKQTAESRYGARWEGEMGKKVLNLGEGESQRGRLDGRMGEWEGRSGVFELR